MKISQVLTPTETPELNKTPATVAEPASVVDEDVAVIEEKSMPVNVTPSADFLNVYGHDMNDPKHKNFSRELRMMKETDPVLYHKIMSMQ